MTTKITPTINRQRAVLADRCGNFIIEGTEKEKQRSSFMMGDVDDLVIGTDFNGY